MNDNRNWRLFPQKKPRQTLAEKLADRMDAFFDACADAIADPHRGKPMGPRASRLACGWLSQADWIRHATYHQMQSLMNAEGVFTPSALAGDAQIRMCSLLAPYVMDDQEFDDLLRAVPAPRQQELSAVRATWLAALAAPPSPVRKSEDTCQALARLHAGTTPRDSYERGRQALRRGAEYDKPPFDFLAPYAIARVHVLSGVGPADPAAAPAFDDLRDWDKLSVTLIHKSLTRRVHILEDMADIGGDGDNYAKAQLATYLQTLQNAAFGHMLGDPLPNPLPMDKPRDLSSMLIDMCNDATLLARHCQLMGPV